MSLERRIILYLLVCAPLVWIVALLYTVHRARLEVNELYDTATVRLALQVQATLPLNGGPLGASAEAAPRIKRGSEGFGDADLRDLATAVWDVDGKLLLADREGSQLAYRPDATGFVDGQIAGKPWRIYYVHSANQQWLVAAAQRSNERNDLIYALTVSQLVPWLLVLPALLIVMGLAVRRALVPLHRLTDEVSSRPADELVPVEVGHAPAELKPLVAAMNGLFTRIDAMLVRERRFTADAAHELRTPLAVLRAQWDVVSRSRDAAERRDAEARLDLGLLRMDRLVTQMLVLSRVDTARALPSVGPLDWQSVIETAVSDVLPLAGQRDIELAVEWPEGDGVALALEGNAELMAVALRNLLDNAVRYSPAGSVVTLRMHADRIEVENAGPALSEAQLAKLGERFARPDGQHEAGSGLGVSIVQRIAELHGLDLRFAAVEPPSPDQGAQGGQGGQGGQGVLATLKPRNPL